MLGGLRGSSCGGMDDDEYKYSPIWTEEVCNVRVELPPPFCGDGRKLFATWIKQFEAAVRAQTRGAGRRSYTATLAALLPTRLDGAAFLLWDSLPATTQGDFERVKERLNEAFGQKQFLLYFQTCVSARPRLANESLELYAADISRLVAEAFPDYDRGAQNGEKFRRFLAGLDPGLRAKCHEQGATDLDEALTIAGRCERARMAMGVGTQNGPCSPTNPATVATLSPAKNAGVDCDATGMLLGAVERLTARMDKLQMDVRDLRASSHGDEDDRRARQPDYGAHMDQRFSCACDCGGVGCRSSAKNYRTEFRVRGRSPQDRRRDGRDGEEWPTQPRGSRGASPDRSANGLGSRSPQKPHPTDGPQRRRGVRFLSPSWRSPSPSPVGRNQGNYQ